MVSIPTSRDIGRIGTRSGRPSVSGPSVSVGAAIVNAGQAMTEVAYDLDALRQQETVDAINKRSLDTSTALTRFTDAEERHFLKAQEEASESGIGFTRSYMEGYQQRANAFAKAHFEGLSDEQASGYLNQILGRGNALYEKAYSFEAAAKSNFYDRTVNQSLDTVRGEIAGNAAPFEQLYSQGLASINSADMPEAWKAERRALWEQDAAESRWQWEYRKDPQAAVNALSHVRHTDVATGIVAAANALGIDPEELATAISYETGGTFDPTKSGPTTKWGTHRGLIQFGEPQAEQYGVDWNDPVASQLGPNGAIVRYLREAGVEPGMGLLDIYSAINAGQVGLYDARDAQAGGAPGTVRDKVEQQMDAHREKARNLLAGSYAPSEFDAIPVDRRLQLAAQGQKEIEAERTASRAAEKDRLNLVIADDPFSIDRETIISNPNLDNGDKASLLNSWNAATKDRADVNAFLSAMSSGKASVNPFDGTERALADKAYDQLMRTTSEPEAAMAGFVSQTGYIPKTVQADLRRGNASTDAPGMQQAMQTADVLERTAPVSFANFEGSGAVRKNLDLYRAYTDDMGYSSEEAAQRVVAANDPEKVRQREVLMKSEPIKDAIEDIDVGDIAASFDRSTLGWARNPSVGDTPAAEAVIVADYRAIYREAIADTNGDLDAARSMADQRFQRIYGVSDLTQGGANVVVKYPPEKAYPANVDGTHEYIRAQLVEALAEEGVEADTVYLQADEATAKDIRAGRPPRYQIFYEQDGRLERYYLPFYADPQEARRRTLEENERRMLENRAAEEQRFPEGRDGPERFSNDRLYRGIAQEGSPLAEAVRRRQERREAESQRRREEQGKRLEEHQRLLGPIIQRFD